MDPQEEVRSFKSRIADPSCFCDLFEHVPGVVFFTKDRACRLMTGNHALLSLLGQTSMETVIGKTGYHFFPKGIADGFETDDQQVMSNGGNPLIDLVELIIDENGTVSWFATTKLPLYDAGGEVVGLMGLTRNLRHADQRLHPFAKLMPVINLMRTSFTKEIEVPTMAKLVGLSPSQFRRTFKSLFRVSPLQFILRLRIQHAANLLRTTRLNVGEVSDNCGFDDQSYFARQFQKHMGVSPTEYRKVQQ